MADDRPIVEQAAELLYERWRAAIPERAHRMRPWAELDNRRYWMTEPRALADAGLLRADYTEDDIRGRLIAWLDDLGKTEEVAAELAEGCITVLVEAGAFGGESRR